MTGEDDHAAKWSTVLHGALRAKDWPTTSSGSCGFLLAVATRTIVVVVAILEIIGMGGDLVLEGH